MATLSLKQTEPEAEDGEEVLDDEEDGAPGSGERDWEAEAIELGWVPQDEFKGDPKRHVDARTFVMRGENMLPLLKAEVKKLRDENKTIRRDTKRYVDFMSKSEERAYQRAMTDLEKRFANAVETGDHAEGQRVFQEMKDLRPQEENKATFTKEDAEDAFDDFREQNPWYDRAQLAGASDDERDARIYADRIAEKMVRQGKAQEMAPQEFFADLNEAVRQRYPSVGQTKQRASRISEVAGATGGRGGRGGHTFDDLPVEAQRFCDRMVKQGYFKNRAEYVKNYDWSDKK